MLPVAHRWAGGRGPAWSHGNSCVEGAGAERDAAPFTGPSHHHPSSDHSNHLLLKFLLPKSKPRTDFPRTSGHGPRCQCSWKLPGSWCTLGCKARLYNMRFLVTSFTLSELGLPQCLCACWSSCLNNFPEYPPRAVFFRSQPRWSLSRALSS